MDFQSRYSKFMNKPLPEDYQNPLVLVEQAIQDLDEERSQNHIYELILSLKQCMDQDSLFYVPLETSEPKDLLEIPKLDLNHILDQNLPAFRTVQMEKGGMAFCAFTSKEEMGKGQPTNYEILKASDLLWKALEDESILGLILNPWGLSILLNKELLSLICEDEEEGTFQSALYIDHGECCQQATDIVVNVGKNPFNFQEPCCAAFLKACGPSLYDICFELPNPDPGKLVISEAPNLLAQRIFHAALPAQEDEKSYTRFIRTILTLADKMGANSISIPAIGTEEGCVDPELPFSVIAAAGWFSSHPQSKMSVTITCRQKDTYENFLAYLFTDDSPI